jgi:hypothetical protein
MSNASYDGLKDLLKKYGLLDSSRFRGVDTLDKIKSDTTIKLEALITSGSSNTFINGDTTSIRLQGAPPRAFGAYVAIGALQAEELGAAVVSQNLTTSTPPQTTGSANLSAMIIEGIGKFLADRAKEELTVAFFQKFQKFLNSYPEIGTLFPTTIKFLNTLLTASSSNMLSTLREAFVSDVKNILGDIAIIPTLKPATACSLASNQSNCISRLQDVQSIFKTDPGRLLVAGLIIADGAINQKNPADILTAIDSNQDVQGFPSEVYNSLELLNIFSNALKSTDPNEIWIPASDLTSMTSNSSLFRYFLAFVYSAVDQKKITIGGHSVTGYLTLTNVQNTYQYVSGLITAVNGLAASYRTLIDTTKSRSDAASILSTSKNFIAAISQFLTQAMKYRTIDPALPSPSQTVTNMLKYTDSALTVVQDLLDKNYYAAFLSLDILVQDIVGPISTDNPAESTVNKKTFISNLLRYGNFIADVISASDVADVENAIEAMALPPGSSSIKKNTNFSITAQAYTGIGLSHIVGANPYFQNFGVSAPIGVAFNVGLRHWCNPLKTGTYGSLSFFIPLVDLGAVVSYEFTNPSNQPSNTTNVTWANIFAPGFDIVYGIPGVPLSVGGGFEYQSALKGLNESGGTLTPNPGIRWNLFLAVDIPVVNFYVSRR